MSSSEKLKRSLAAIIPLKILSENRNLFSILGMSKLALRKPILKQGTYKEFIYLISKLCLNLMEGNAQLPEVVKQQTKHHHCIVRALACKKKGKDFKGKYVLQAGRSFFHFIANNCTCIQFSLEKWLNPTN